MARGSKRGKPRKPAAERRSSVITIRVHEQTHAALEAAAKAAGGTVSQEVQRRVDRSFEQQGMLLDVLAMTYGPQLAGLLLAIGQAMDSVGPYAAFDAATPDTRSTWLENPYAYDQAEKAVTHLLSCLRSNEPIAPPQLASILEARGVALGTATANSILQSIAGQSVSTSLDRFGNQVRALLPRQLIEAAERSARQAAAIVVRG